VNDEVDLPQIDTRSGVGRHSGERGVVVGVYEQVDLHPRPGRAPRHRGHVAVALEDGQRVLLEPSWSAKALRPEQERIAFEGRRVAVTGLLHEHTPEPEQPTAMPLMPCVAPVEAVRALQ
jgi:hypothetical protein